MTCAVESRAPSLAVSRAMLAITGAGLDMSWSVDRRLMPIIVSTYNLKVGEALADRLSNEAQSAPMARPFVSSAILLQSDLPTVPAPASNPRCREQSLQEVMGF